MGSLTLRRTPETELKDRKILKIRRKKEEEETLESAEEIASTIEAEIKEDTRSKKERKNLDVNGL